MNESKSVQATLERLDLWLSTIRHESGLDETLALYLGLVREEFKEAQDALTLAHTVKELADVVVVCRPMTEYGSGHQMKFHHHISQAAKAYMHEIGVNWWQAVAAVTESNFTKLILEHEIEDALKHFETLGIEVDIVDLGHGYFGAYSAFDQSVNGKDYPAGKLLKGHKYAPVDESVEFWL